jgi:hypothetical protein
MELEGVLGPDPGGLLSSSLDDFSMFIIIDEC